MAVRRILDHCSWKKRRKVAAADRRRHGPGLAAARNGADPVSLVAAEQEQLVLDDRPPQRGSGLVSLEAIGKSREEAVCVHCRVPHEPEGITMHGVCPALG